MISSAQRVHLVQERGGVVGTQMKEARLKGASSNGTLTKFMQRWSQLKAPLVLSTGITLRTSAEVSLLAGDFLSSHPSLSTVRMDWMEAGTGFFNRNN